MTKTISEASILMQFEAHRKSATPGYILWFFLGLMGAHRFYAEKWKTALLQLLGGLSWIGGAGIYTFTTALSSDTLSSSTLDANNISGGGYLILCFALFCAIWTLLDVFFINRWIRKYNLKLANSLSSVQTAQ